MNNKDVIYVDVEDEITGIIDKVANAKQKVVALVLPKRATVFHSVVNMKLLKKKAADAKKNVILVTSEGTLLPLAGAVGLYVSKSLQAKPELPPNPNVLDDEDSVVSLDDPANSDESDLENQDDSLDKDKTIGELAGLAAVGAVAAKASQPDPEDNIEFDNDALGDPMGLEDIDDNSKDKSKKDKKSKGAKGIDGKKTKVPDFNKFRRNLIIGAIALVALIVLYILCFKVLPKATIIVQTNTSSINSNITMTLSTSATSLDASNNTVPAKQQVLSKNTTSTPVNTTGTKTVGTPAAGTINIVNPCPSQSPNGSNDAVQVPAGTVFSDANGNNYTSNNAATVTGYNKPPGKFSTCTPGGANISVTATTDGTNANNPANNTSYTSSDSDLSGFSITGGPMTGGSSKNVQVVAQADITSAQNQLQSANTTQIQQQLENSLTSEGYQPISATFVATTPTYSPSAAVGAQANTVTVTETAVYTMYGVHQSDLNTLITSDVNQQINPNTQSILSLGSDKSTFTIQSTGSSTDSVAMQTTSTVGPILNTTKIAQESAGQKSGDIKASLSTTPGVTNVIVKYSPFWVGSTPKNTNKITVIIQKSDGSQL